MEKSIKGFTATIAKSPGIIEDNVHLQLKHRGMDGAKGQAIPNWVMHWQHIKWKSCPTTGS